MIRRPPRSTLDRSSAASDVYKRQLEDDVKNHGDELFKFSREISLGIRETKKDLADFELSLIHISEPTRPY